MKIINIQTQPSEFNILEKVSQGLSKEPKQLPTLLLYDDRGLQLFDEITYLSEYYPTLAEIQLLQQHSDKIASSIKDDSIVIELGSGSLRKTKLLLDSINQQRRNITYCALDLMEKELIKSLQSLDDYENITLQGLWGTYDDGFEYIKLLPATKPKVILFLGSSISGFTRSEAKEFVSKIQTNLSPGNRLILGVHHRTTPDRIALAYNDPKGVTRDFILNGLNHANNLLGKDVFKLDNFSYDPQVLSEQGCHESYIRSECEQTIQFSCPQSKKEYQFTIKEGEKIHLESSYQYSVDELDSTIQEGGFNLAAQWFYNNYSLNILYKPPFVFRNIPDNTPIPNLAEWEELWRAWNYIITVLITPDMLLMKPINLRHPFIFYLGHIPAFLDIQLSKHFKSPLTEPAVFAEYFERGIDPDVDDPTKCHAHSKIPKTWPSLESILKYQQDVQERLTNIMKNEPLTTRSSRVLSYGFEHQAMHLETLLYMLIRAPTIGPIEDSVLPLKSSRGDPAPAAFLLNIPDGEVIIGLDDDERTDHEIQLNENKFFGWDNEYPPRSVNVKSFQIQSRPVTNGEFLAFITATVNRDYPASWIPLPDRELEFQVRTLLGPVSMETALNWPVFCSHAQAQSYSFWLGSRLPTESELLRSLDFSSQISKTSTTKPLTRTPKPNVGFQVWHPREVSNYESQFLGDGWEWTNTPLQSHPGFKSSDLYPGYSQDFFDGKHIIMLGGSYTTHPRLVRRSFRNWYQRSYLYPFATFRCVI